MPFIIIMLLLLLLLQLAVKNSLIGTGVVICPESGENYMHMVQLADVTATPSSVASLKSRLPAYPRYYGKETVQLVSVL